MTRTKAAPLQALTPALLTPGFRLRAPSSPPATAPALPLRRNTVPATTKRPRASDKMANGRVVRLEMKPTKGGPIKNPRYPVAKTDEVACSISPPARLAASEKSKGTRLAIPKPATPKAPILIHGVGASAAMPTQTPETTALPTITVLRPKLLANVSPANLP